MFKPTKQQLSAINENGSILVTAAAGSGKTAVLVERVIRKLTDRQNPTSIDRMLIVTFTNAAAAEMRLRIEKRLNEEIQNNPGDSRLLRQALLIPSARICTIDSFCINLVRENFEQFGIEPDFKIVQDDELRLLYEKAMKQALDWFYENEPERLTSLFTALQSAYGDDAIAEMVLDVFKYSRNLPFPDHWLDKCADMYKNSPKEAVKAWRNEVGYMGEEKLTRAKNSLLYAESLLKEDKKLCDAYSEKVSSLINNIDEVLSLASQDVDMAMAKCIGITIPKVTHRGNIEVLSPLKTAIGLAGEAIEEYSQNGGGNEEFLLREILMSAPHVCTVIDVTKLFSEILSELMRKEKVLTFYNTEQLCLSLLCEDNGESLVMSEKAKEITESIDEILVDEYQDTNDLQDTLFHMLSCYGKKLFSVGDVKQSIYGFRGANPENFVNKKEEYAPLEAADENSGKKIILSANFRSRKGICDFVNYFCSLLMSKSLGGVEYNEEEILNSSAEFPACELPETEMHFLTADEESAEITEAKHIAAYIKNCAQSEKFLRDGDGLREARYGDFCILLRSPGTHSDVYMQELKKLGIPARINNGGFLNTREISAALALLKVINNPTHDVPLLAVMMSPIFGFTASEVADIRLCKRDGSLYSALLMAEKEGNEKAETLLSDLRKFRRAAVYKPLPELISWLYDETGLLDAVSALEDGERRRNNLLTLCRISENYSAAGIAAFIAYVEKIGDDIRSSSGNAGKNAVSIVSFHNSKGLQYPICIIAGCFRKFNMSDLGKPLLRDRKLGISLKIADETENRVVDGVAREAIQKAYKASLHSEELRTMYVALTRAEERLVVVMTGSKSGKTAEKVAEAINTDTDAALLSAAGGFYEWFLYVMLRNKNCESVRDVFGVTISPEKLVDCVCRIKTVFGACVCDEEHTQQEQQKTAYVNTEDIKQRFEYRYPFGDLTKIYAKTSVSEIVSSDKTGNDFSGRPAFASRAGLTPAERGTATHKFMQYCDYASAAKDIDTELKRLVESKFISAEEAAAIDEKALKAFFGSKLYSRMEKAYDLHREMRFLSEMSARELFLVDSDEKTVVQGVIDCVIEEDDGITVVDFKTDKVRDAKALADLYSKQLDIYASACEKIFSKPVKEKILYSFALNTDIKI